MLFEKKIKDLHVIITWKIETYNCTFKKETCVFKKLYFSIKFITPFSSSLEAQILKP